MQQQYSNLVGNLPVIRADLLQARITSAVPAINQAYVMEQGNTAFLFTEPIRIWGIEVLTRSQLTNSVNGNYTTITQAAAANITVTLYEGSVEKIRNVAATSMIKSLNGGFTMLLGGFEVNLTKSKITLVNPAGIAQNEVLLFQIYYSFVIPRANS